ncbi:hypothetical protein NB705_001419 [Xanthomonas sacchari]|nr:hypothetical protein [Xanthomonas sacchari]
MRKTLPRPSRPTHRYRPPCSMPSPRHRRRFRTVVRQRPQRRPRPHRSRRHATTAQRPSLLRRRRRKRRSRLWTRRRGRNVLLPRRSPQRLRRMARTRRTATSTRIAADPRPCRCSVKEAAFGPLFSFGHPSNASIATAQDDRLYAYCLSRVLFGAAAVASPPKPRQHSLCRGSTSYTITLQERLQPRRGFPDAPVAAEAAPAKTRDAWSTCCAEGYRSVLKIHHHMHVRVVARSLQSRVMYRRRAPTPYSTAFAKPSHFDHGTRQCRGRRR